MLTPLRIGLLLDSLSLKAWQALAISNILEGKFASIELLVLNDHERQPSRLALPYIAYRAFTRLDHLLFRSTPDAFEIVDGKRFLSEVPQLKVKSDRKKYSDVLNSEDIKKIKDYNLDVLVRFGFRILRGEILNAAHCGVWSLHHGDNNVVRGGPPGFWEVIEKQPVTGSMLQILTEDLDNGKVLCRSFSITDSVSVIRNRNNYYFKTALFLPRKLKELHSVGKTLFLEKVDKQNQNPEFYSEKLYRNPRNGEMILKFFKLSYHALKNKLSNILNFEQWVILFSCQKNASSSLWRFHKMVPPKDRFWADPHAIQREGKSFIFLEEFLFKTHKGHISVIEMDSSGHYSEPKKVLERPYHLSYPFVFEWQNDIYMIPESAANRTIEMYKCVEFPHRWKFQMNLMENVLATDSTLFHYGKKWWLFTNMREHEGVSAFDELFLFHSQNFMTEAWTPHPLNPIVSDCRKARSAGKIFMKGDKIYRPAQNCSYRYGYGIKIQEIKTLSEASFEETEVCNIEPNWDKRIRRIHTLNEYENLVVADAKISRSKW
jgi:hypothetical protein